MQVEPAAANIFAGTFRPMARFGAEFLGMCAVMCLGGGMLIGAFFEGAASLGYPSLAREAPELSTLAVVVGLALPMVTYMAIRGHGRRHNVEMTLITFAMGILTIGVIWIGFIPRDGLRWESLFGLVCGPACLLMFVQMLFNFDVYSGRGNHEHAHAA